MINDTYGGGMVHSCCLFVCLFFVFLRGDSGRDI